MKLFGALWGFLELFCALHTFVKQKAINHRGCVCVCVWNHAYLLDYSAISEREPRELRARRAAASLVSSVQKGPPPTERCEPNQLLPHNADSDAGRDGSVDSSSDLAAKGGWVYVFSLRIAHVRVNKREWQSKDECERDRESYRGSLSPGRGHVYFCLLIRPYCRHIPIPFEVSSRSYNFECKCIKNWICKTLWLYRYN